MDGLGYRNLWDHSSRIHSQGTDCVETSEFLGPFQYEYDAQGNPMRNLSQPDTATRVCRPVWGSGWEETKGPPNGSLTNKRQLIYGAGSRNLLANHSQPDFVTGVCCSVSSSGYSGTDCGETRGPPVPIQNNKSHQANVCQSNNHVQHISWDSVRRVADDGEPLVDVPARLDNQGNLWVKHGQLPISSPVQNLLVGPAQKTQPGVSVQGDMSTPNTVYNTYNKT